MASWGSVCEISDIWPDQVRAENTAVNSSQLRYSNRQPDLRQIQLPIHFRRPAALGNLSTSTCISLITTSKHNFTANLTKQTHKIMLAATQHQPGCDIAHFLRCQNKQTPMITDA